MQKIGAEYIPAITWVVADSAFENLEPQLGIGFAERALLDEDRLVECPDFTCAIGRYIPAHVLERHSDCHVDLSEGYLTFVPDSDDAAN